ncbi:nucleotidyl transferase AbiEii/AbiGii toxin family protein [Verrucomicrobiota bacterium]
MKIEEVIHETILALYREPNLSTVLFLKGGSAMRFFDQHLSRLSVDIDFSIQEGIVNEKQVFGLIKKSLGKAFRAFRLDIIDFTWRRRPKRKGGFRPDWWGGWACEFKLISSKYRGKTLEVKRRNALVPAGSNSSKILLDISEHEYCGQKRQKKIGDVIVLGYSRELIVLEKIRAICQQSPNYKYTLNKSRARDFYDLYQLTRDIGPRFIGRCRKHLKKVFEAKEVPLPILRTLWNKAFVDEQERGFDQVRDSVEGPIRDFAVYVENLRFLIREICPEHGEIPESGDLQSAPD